MTYKRTIKGCDSKVKTPSRRSDIGVYISSQLMNSDDLQFIERRMWSQY